MTEADEPPGPKKRTDKVILAEIRQTMRDYCYTENLRAPKNFPFPSPDVEDTTIDIREREAIDSILTSLGVELDYKRPILKIRKSKNLNPGDRAAKQRLYPPTVDPS